MRFTLVFLFAAAVASGESLERSVSTSRQFIIYSDNAQLRGAVSDLAEQVKRNTMSILHESDRWKTPIILNLQTPRANAPDIPSKSLRFSQTGAGLKIQLDLVIGADVRAVEIQREILRAVLLERIYRNHSDIAPGSPYAEPPDWLLEGILAQFAGTAVAATGQTSLEEFLRQRPNDLDAPARELYRAGSLALWRVVVDLARNSGGLTRYIDNLANASNASLGDLLAQFPGLTTTDLDKLWRARTASLSSQKLQLARFAETEAQLARALQIKIHGKDLTLADFAKTKLSATEKAALDMTAENLMLIGANAHPVLRPIVSEYQQIAQLLAARKRKGVGERLSKLRETRRRLVRRMDDIDDYLNWFEATQMTDASGVFDEYLRASRSQKVESHRHDAMATYLDAIEQQTGE